MFASVSDMASRAGFLDLVVIACVVLYIASRVIRQDWATTTANRFRNAVAWLFYVFAIILLIMSLTRISGCEQQRYNPKVKQDQVPTAQAVPEGKVKMPDNKKQ